MKTITIILGAILASQVLASNFKISNESTIQFVAKGNPAFVKISGTGKKLTGEITKEEKNISGMILIDLSTIETGIELRDSHLKEKYLEVEKFPTSSLKDIKASDSKFKAMLTLHGVAKEVTGTFKNENPLIIEAEFKIKLSEFNVEIPSFQGITVADSVDIKAIINIEETK